MFNVLWNILLGIVGGIISSVIVSRVFFIQGEYQQQTKFVDGIDQSVKIGNGNTICDSTIASLVQEAVSPKKTFWEKHPLLLGVIGAVIAGVILTFSFWGKIVAFIEGVF